MAGFKANSIEALTYDFRPHVKVEGEIPEPSTPQIEKYRQDIGNAIKALGLDPTSLTGSGISLENMDLLLDKSAELEEAMLAATGELCQIDKVTLDSLPYRVSRAFMGYIMGEFFSPEA